MPLAFLGWSLDAWCPSVRAACCGCDPRGGGAVVRVVPVAPVVRGDCDPCGGGAVVRAVPAPGPAVRPIISAARMIRAGFGTITPPARTRNADPNARYIYALAGNAATAASSPSSPLPPPVITRSDYAASPESPETAAPAPGPPVSAGREEDSGRQAQWQPVAWAGVGPTRADVQPAPEGGKGAALRIRTAESEGSGDRPPTEKWAASLAAPWDKGDNFIFFDVFNGTRHSIHLALGVFVAGNDAQRIYFESETRVLEPGWNRRLHFSGLDAKWKTESVQWRFEARWATVGQAVETVFLLYDAPDDPGVYIDGISHGGDIVHGY